MQCLLMTAASIHFNSKQQYLVKDVALRGVHILWQDAQWCISDPDQVYVIFSSHSPSSFLSLLSLSIKNGKDQICEQINRSKTHLLAFGTQVIWSSFWGHIVSFSFNIIALIFVSNTFYIVFFVLKINAFKKCTFIKLQMFKNKDPLFSRWITKS